MKITVQRVYNPNFEDEQALINVETNETLVVGDIYHDKIDDRIEGFISGMKTAGYEVEEIESKEESRKEFVG